MNKDILNKGIEDMKNIHLTASEKSVMFKKIMQTPIASPFQPQKTWWNFRELTRVQFAYMLSGIMLIMGSGGAVAYASQSSIPGDVLYPVKIHVTEPIQYALAFTPAAKAQVDAANALQRLDEAQKLAQENRLTPQYQNDIKNHFNESVARLNTDMQSLGTTTPAAQNINASFHNAVQAHSDILQKFGFPNEAIQNKSEQYAQEITHSTPTSTDQNFIHSTSSVRGGLGSWKHVGGEHEDTHESHDDNNDN